MPENTQTLTAPPGFAPTNGSAFSLTQCGGEKGWRYRLLHWLSSRWGYFPIPWDAPDWHMKLRDKHGADPSEWPEDLQGAREIIT